MEHNHNFENNDVLIYNIKYIDNGKYLVRFASKSELSVNDTLSSNIIRRTTNSGFNGICTSIIESDKNKAGYFVSIAEFVDPNYESDRYAAVEMNAKIPY